MSDQADTEVLYNASCPVCRAEIGHYARYAKAQGLAIRFDDLNGPELERWGLDADVAARRLYVWKDGTLLSGIDGFIALWAQMPRYRWLARMVGLPGLRQMAGLVYDYVLAPVIYRWHRRRVSRAAHTQP